MLKQLFLGLAIVAPEPVFAATLPSAPPIVNTYAVQQATMCRQGPNNTPVVIPPERADLNGDGLQDWIFDAGKLPCAATNPMVKEYGALVTVFVARPDGSALAGFQHPAHGAHLERLSGKVRLVIGVSGADCGAGNPAQRCERLVIWSKENGRLEPGAR